MKSRLQQMARLVIGILLVVWTQTSVLYAAAADLVFQLPTENRALYHGGGDAYYMYVDRDFEGVKSTPWQGGAWGMVRTPFRASNGQIYFSRMHEGIDVKPIRRDANGEPLDEVHPIAPGIVAYTSDDPRKSNYGRYVVLAHKVPEGTIYSLYAHLASVCCEVGQQVRPMDTLGILGYSGVGLNKTRAHCHLEICFMINAAYDRIVLPPTNKHGLFNGLNLIGFDPTDVLLACKGGKPFSLSRYLAGLQEHYRVRVPNVGTMDILKRHPFLYKGRWGGPRPVALDIAFTREGIPIAIYPANQSVTTPKIVHCRPLPTLQQNCTVNRVKGSSKTAQLTASGLRYINLFLWQQGVYPPTPDTTAQP